MTDTAVATINKPPIVVLRERLEARRNELQAALTDVSPDQFIRALITSATINPDLQACTWSSLWLACMRACRDQLLPDGREGAIVAYGSTATWIPMYQGLLKRFRQSGQFKWITAGLVQKGEKFEHYIDERGEHFLHVPGDGFNMKAVTKIYAMAHTKDGGFFVTVMPAEEVEKHRKESKAKREDAPWSKWPEEMMKKTALRRLAKLLPIGRDYVPEDEDSVAMPTLSKPAPVQAISQSPEPPPHDDAPDDPDDEDNDEADFTGELHAHDQALEAAAREGTDALAQVWKSIPPSYQAHLDAGYRRRHLPNAERVDKEKAKGA